MQLCLAKEKKEMSPFRVIFPIKFYRSAFDNFNHAHKNTLLGNASTHVIAVTVFSGKKQKTFAKTVEEWSAIEQCADIEKTVMSTANTVYQGKALEVARIN